MKKLIGGGLMALVVGVGVAMAPPASANPEQEYEFLQALGSLGSDYASWPQFLSGIEPVPVGYQVCSTLDHGGDPLAPVLQAAGHSPYPDYHAAIFAGYAIHHLCPEHAGKVGPV